MKKNTLPILMMFALFFIISFVTGLQNPMGVIVKSQFDTTNILSQLGNAAIFIAYAFMGIPSGKLLQHIGYKKTALAATAIGFIGVSITYLSGQMGSFSTYVIGAFISGFSMCMLNTTVNPLLNTLGGGGNKGNQLIQMGGTINSIGATIVPILVGLLMGETSKANIADAYPALYIAMFIFFCASIMLLMMQIPEPHLENTKNNDLKSPLKYKHFTFGAIAIFIYVGVEVGIPNFANLYMIEQLGIDTGIAGTIIGTYWFLMLVGRFFGALLAARLNSRTMLASTALIAICLIVAAILLPTTGINMPVFRSNLSFGFEVVPINVILLVLCGLCTSVMWGGIFNLAVKDLGNATTAASGIFMTMVCGGGILPLAQGLLADHTSYTTSYIIVTLGFAYILWYALYGSKNNTINSQPH